MKITKLYTSTLILLLTASSMLWIESASAQMFAPQPSVPEFTIAIVDRSYDVPTTNTTTTDPFTGNQVIHTRTGYHVTNRTLDITIKNQPFSPIDFGNGSVATLYFSIRMKGHYASWDSFEYSDGYYSRTIQASTSDNTVVTLRFCGDDGAIFSYDAEVVIPDNGQEDIQVRAEVGYKWYTMDETYWGTSYFTALAGSGWSDIKTLSMPDGNITITPFSGPAESPIPYTIPSPTPHATLTLNPYYSPFLTQNPTTTPIDQIQTGFMFEFSWEHIVIAIMALVIAVLLVSIAILRRKLPRK